MKITKEKVKFEPITITLENSEEMRDIMYVLNYYLKREGFHGAANDLLQKIRELKES